MPARRQVGVEDPTNDSQINVPARQDPDRIAESPAFVWGASIATMLTRESVPLVTQPWVISCLPSASLDFRLATFRVPGQVVLSVMPLVYRITLNNFNLGQFLVGLRTRADSWGPTKGYLHTETMPEGKFFLIEESGKPEEPDDIVENYRLIIRMIQTRMEAQLSAEKPQQTCEVVIAFTSEHSAKGRCPS